MDNLTENELDYVARAIAQRLFRDHNDMVTAQGDTAKRVYAFDVVYANNIARKAGIFDRVDQRTMEQTAEMVQNAVDELARQNWTEYAPGVITGNE